MLDCTARMRRINPHFPWGILGLRRKRFIIITLNGIIRNLYPEGTTPTGCLLDPCVTVKNPGYFLHRRQANPGPTGFIVFLSPIKQFENALPLFCGDSDSVITNEETDSILFAFTAHINYVPCLTSVFQCIPNEVLENLKQECFRYA